LQRAKKRAALKVLTGLRSVRICCMGKRRKVRVEGVRGRSVTGVQLRDHMGRPVDAPTGATILSASLLRGFFIEGKALVGKYDADGVAGDPVRDALVRAQIPYLVTLLMYSSKFQLEATRREYLLYAPMDVKSAAKLAFQLWRRWEKPARAEWDVCDDLENDYPKLDDAAVVEPIDDATFDDQWRSARTRKHRAAGDQDDPFAFTCLDQDVMLFKAADFQQGLRVTV
jgi:hypothetical protein